MMTAQTALTVIGLLLVVGLSVLPWALNVHGKLAEVRRGLTDLIGRMDTDRAEHHAEHQRIWQRLEKHDDAIANLRR